MRSGADLRMRSLMVSFNHVTDPHSVTFCSNLYTTICNPKPNPNRNATVITDPQTGSIDPQIVTVLIRRADPLRAAFGRVPPYCHYFVQLVGSVFVPRYL